MRIDFSERFSWRRGESNDPPSVGWAWIQLKIGWALQCMLGVSKGFLAFGFHFAVLERDVPTIKANHAHNSFGTSTLPLVDCYRLQTKELAAE